MTAASYRETYRLKIPPFGDDIDDRFFYGGSALMQRLDLLTHLTQFGESVILVGGPGGSGKSTLLRHYISHTAAQWRICALNAHAFDRFASLLADALNIEPGRNELELLEHWAAVSDASQLLVVIIDDADQLDDSAFQRLDALLRHPHAERVRLLLFGTEQLNQKIQSAQSRQLISCSTQPLEIPRLTEEETASYLMYRLAVAGYSGESPFSATEIRGICKAAEGRPGDINKLAHQALEERHARVKTQKTPVQAPRKNRTALWATASVAAISLALYLGWQRMEPPADPGTMTRTAQISKEETPLSLPPAHQTGVPDPVAPQIATPAAPSAAMETADIATILTAAEEPETEPGSTASGEPAATTSPLPLPQEQHAEAEDPSSTSPVTPVASTEPVEIEKTGSSMAQQAQPVPATAPVTPAEAEPVAATDTGEPVEVQPVAAKPDGPHDEAWLLQQDGNKFSLQLLGSRNEQAISGFIRKHQLNRDKTAYYRGVHKGKPWYVLMYGSYPSRKAALEARSELPPAVRKGNPWPREMKSVQKAIETRS